MVVLGGQSNGEVKCCSGMEFQGELMDPKARNRSSRYIRSACDLENNRKIY